MLRSPRTEVAMAIASPHSLDIAETASWLVDGARSASNSQDVLAELCKRLVEGGLPLWRVAGFVETLHPLIMGRRFVWGAGAEVDVASVPNSFVTEATFLTSPIARVRITGETIRRRLADPCCP